MIPGGADSGTGGAFAGTTVRGVEERDAGVETTKVAIEPASTTKRSDASPEFVATLTSCVPGARSVIDRGAVPRGAPSSQTRAPAGPGTLRLPPRRIGSA